MTTNRTSNLLKWSKFLAEKSRNKRGPCPKSSKLRRPTVRHKLYLVLKVGSRIESNSFISTSAKMNFALSA